LAAIYAEQVIGFQPQETMILIFVLNIAAFVGSLLFGYAQDRMGHKLALASSLVGWSMTCVLAALTTSKEVFWWAAALAGLCMGSSQSTGRAMAGLFIPTQRLAEFFGLWTFAIRLASIVGPLGYGLITWVTAGNQRLAIGATTVMFLVGLALLLPINVQRGQHMAQKQT
jgi:UMF1 family MFS transporter